MAQNTVAGTAYNQLRPLEGTNLGAILEEHTRYYQKRKDDEEAKQQAQKAQQAKFLAAQNKDALAIYEGIQPSESEGFLNTQIIETFERNKEKYKDLARAYANGNLEAGLQLKEIGKKYENLVLANTTYSKKAQSLAELQKQGIYNEYLDAETDAFRQAVAGGFYKINDDLSINILDPGRGEVINMPNGSLLSNSYLQTSFHPKAQFEKYGENIASKLLDDNYGFKVETKKVREDGIRLVQGILAKDDVERRSFLSYVRKNEVKNRFGETVKFNDDEGNPLTMAQIGDNKELMNKFESLYYDNFVRTQLQQKRTDNTTKEDKEEKTKTNIGIVTGGVTGNRDTFYFKEDLFYEYSKGNKKTRVTPDRMVRDGNNVIITGKETEFIPQRIDYEDGTYDIDWVEGRTKTVEIDDPVIKNKIANKFQINGKRPETLTELPALLDEIKPQSNSTQSRSNDTQFDWSTAQ